jgi:structural maintenance of chromosome 2
MKNPAEIEAKHKELEDIHNNLSRSINKKALAMMEKAEEEYDSLDRKRRTIESDRIAIERVISGLDKKKNEALVAAYEKVNKDFGSIFSMLLPGARAELRPVEGGSVLDGLEVKVAFGQTWKDSLTELSGGQRSLLALSLVLALLRFKPAPLCKFPVWVYDQWEY